jgi:acyl-CoA reductase-like NAD-dependent aldehyde dehydrogenase
MSASVSVSLLDAVTTAPDRGRAIPDAATREIIGYAPRHTVADLEAAIAAARAAQPSWAALGHERRAELLNLIADDIEANAEELAVILSREQRKPGYKPLAGASAGAKKNGAVHDCAEFLDSLPSSSPLKETENFD